MEEIPRFGPAIGGGSRWTEMAKNHRLIEEGIWGEGGRAGYEARERERESEAARVEQVLLDLNPGIQ